MATRTKYVLRVVDEQKLADYGFEKHGDWWFHFSGRKRRYDDGMVYDIIINPNETDMTRNAINDFHATTDVLCLLVKTGMDGVIKFVERERRTKND